MPAEELWDNLPLGAGVTVLARDANGLLALDKPAGVLSHPNESADQARSLLTCRYDSEGECFGWRPPAGEERRLWLLNRLDGATSGVILLAAQAELARAVRETFARKTVGKTYVALVFGRPAERMQHWRDLLAVQKKGGQIRTAAGTGNVPAETQFELLGHQQGAFSTSLIRLKPRTGRSHQLRVQCAKRGLPIVGDQTYGDFGMNREFARATGEKRMFLHSLETSFGYELGGKRWNFRAQAPLPQPFRARY